MGRRLGYLGRYRDAIDDLLAAASRSYPSDVRLLRYRGHRYITVREPDKAIADLAKADELIRAAGPDGRDRARRAPGPPGPRRSTLFFNVYYHLGLAHYLKGDFAAARRPTASA